MFWIKTVSQLWHSKYEGDDQNNLWIDIALGESKTVNRTAYTSKKRRGERCDR